MPRLKDVKPVTDTVWLANPSGNVVCVLINSAAADKARNKEGGWFYATEDQIEHAKEMIERRGAAYVAAQEKAQQLRIATNARVTPNVKVEFDEDAPQSGEHFAVPDAPVRRGPGRPRKVQAEE